MSAFLNFTLFPYNQRLKLKPTRSKGMNIFRPSMSWKMLKPFARSAADIKADSEHFLY